MYNIHTDWGARIHITQMEMVGNNGSVQ